MADDTDAFTEAQLSGDLPVTGAVNVLANDSDDPDASDNPVAVVAATGVAAVSTDGSATVLGTIDFAADGSYTLLLNAAGKAASAALDDGESLKVAADYTATNADTPPQTETATLTITIGGSGAYSPTIEDGTIQVTEEGLPGGHPDSIGQPQDDAELAIDTGTLLVTPGTLGSQVVTFDTTNLASLDGVYESNDVAVTFTSPDAKTIVGSAGGTEVIRVELTDDSGNYKATLSQAFDHAIVNVEDELTIPLTVRASDGVNPADTAVLSVIVEDDSPTMSSAMEFAVDVPVSDLTAGSLTADWVAIAPANRITESSDADSVSLRWGNSTGSGQSGYDFDYASAFVGTPEVDANVPFALVR